MKLENLLRIDAITVMVIVIAGALGMAMGYIYVGPSVSDKLIAEIGKIGNSALVKELELDEISEEDASVLAGKIEKLTPENHLSRRLFELASAVEGPFELVQREIKVRLLDDSKINKKQAIACAGSELFGRELILYGATSSGMIKIPYPENAQEFRTFFKNMALSDCVNSPNIIWIGRTTAAEWLGFNPTEEMPSEFGVTASLGFFL